MGTPRQKNSEPKSTFSGPSKRKIDSAKAAANHTSINITSNNYSPENNSVQLRNVLKRNTLLRNSDHHTAPSNKNMPRTNTEPVINALSTQNPFTERRRSLESTTIRSLESTNSQIREKFLYRRSGEWKQPTRHSGEWSAAGVPNSRHSGQWANDVAPTEPGHSIVDIHPTSSTGTHPSQEISSSEGATEF